MLTKKCLHVQDVSEEEEEEKITQTKDQSHSPFKEQNWVVCAKREQEMDRAILELKREVSRYKREERRIARNSLGENKADRLEKLRDCKKNEKMLTIQKEEMDKKEQAAEDRIGQDSPHSQCVVSAHVSQLREEKSGTTRGSLDGQTEMTNGDWRGGEGLAERGVATDDVGLYWVVTNLIGDFPVATKEGNLSNASTKTFTHGTVEGGTVTATAAAQLSQGRGMEQRTLRVFTAENNPSGEGVDEDDGTINPTMENCVDNGGTMAFGGLSPLHSGPKDTCWSPNGRCLGGPGLHDLRARQHDGGRPGGGGQGVNKPDRGCCVVPG